jgi:all-trans-retinol dehydrogenase (NAD+)
MKQLANKRVLVTGSGHGLGLETARAFAQEGAVVIITDRDPKRVEQAVLELQDDNHKAAGYVMDVTCPDDVRAVRAQINKELGPISVLVNNAGIVSGGEFLDVSLNQHITTYMVNSHGPVIVTHIFLPDLLAMDEGHVVNIASASALIALPRGTTYAASKWATLGFTESLREELIQTGQGRVGVTAICPSYINTGMFNGVKPPRLVGLLTPQWLAARIVTSVKKNRAVYAAPFLVKLLPLARATWPRPLFRILLSMLGVLHSMEEWQGHRARMAAEKAANEKAATEKAAHDSVRVAG